MSTTRSLASLLTALMLSMLAPVSGAAIKIEFSGVFDTCEQDCPGSRVAPLLGTSFSGELVFPASGVDLNPADPIYGSYRFDGQVAHLTFSSSLPVFGLDQAAPITVFVRDCEGDLCSANDDAVNVTFRTGGLMYDLALSGIGGPTLFSDAIPDVATLAALHPGFGIWDEALYYSANKFASVETDPYALVPRNFQISISNVPLPAAGWCLAGGILLLRRRMSSR